MGTDKLKVGYSKAYGDKYEGIFGAAPVDDKELIAAKNFYDRSPDGQYDEIASRCIAENILLRQGFKARSKCIGCVGGDPACQDCHLSDPNKYLKWCKEDKK